MNKSIVTLLLLLTGFSVNAQQFPNPIHIPDTLTGPVYNLEVIRSKTQFLSGDSTPTYGINGSYLGPTLIMQAGDSVQMHVTNRLGETSTMHWHGMHVAPENDGGPHTPILADSTWSPTFPVLEEATTFWYHPHLHHKTAEQVYYGAAGMIIVRDNKAVNQQLPHTYGVDEFPLIIQDKSFDSTNALIFTSIADTMMVNGTLGGYLEVPAQMVRFHILNASNQRVYNLGLPPTVDAWQIGSDGGYLENPVPVNRIQLTPGERVEIVVDFASNIPPNTRMISFSSELGDGLAGGPRGPRGRPNNMLDSLDFPIMEFRVIPQTTNAITQRPPMNLNTYNKPLEVNADRYRTKIFTVDTSGFPFYINGLLMDMNVINDTVRLDDIEVWSIINNTDEAHPWHIHDVQFYILDINGMPPPPTLAGRKDVIIVQPYDTIRYITKFDDFANDTVPYMFHCHNLFHEDAGMMGQFIVTNPVGINEVKQDLGHFQAFPNPTKGKLTIQTRGAFLDEIKSIELVSIDGKRIDAAIDINRNSATVHLDGKSSGIYFAKITNLKGQTEVIKFVKD